MPDTFADTLRRRLARLADIIKPKTFVEHGNAVALVVRNERHFYSRLAERGKIPQHLLGRAFHLIGCNGIVYIENDTLYAEPGKCGGAYIINIVKCHIRAEKSKKHGSPINQ